MSVEFTTELILQYRYWILVPLSLLEGPAIAFVAGTLATMGYFNMYFLAVLFFVRDVGLDLIYYAIGHYGAKTAFVRRMPHKIGITPGHLVRVQTLWEKKPFWTMFVGKISYGIASAFIIVAGMVKMPLKTFIKYGSIVAVLQYGSLLLLGYFLGASFGGSVVSIIHNIEYVVAFAAIALSGYYLFSRFMRGKLFKADAEIGALPPDRDKETAP